MALLHVQFYSNVLGKACGMEVLLPEPYKQHPGLSSPGYPEKLKTLYLLHGLTNDHTAWARQSLLEKYCTGLPMAVIMPDGGRSFYADMVAGPKYWTFLSEELPRLCEHMFPLSTKREDRYACGLSMGGFGAVKLGVNLPHRYSYIASLSGSLQMNNEIVFGSHDVANTEFGHIFGSLDQFVKSDNDLFYHGEQLCQHPADAPKFYVACGSEDPLLLASASFLDTFQDRLPITYVETPGGHDWTFWDAQLKQVINWLPVSPMHQKDAM